MDGDKRFEWLLRPIRDLAQNWNIDVAKDLEGYLEELEDITISFDGGKTNVNFAQAALLIQGSACIYSRKVEYLYTLIYQALEMLHSQGKTKRGVATGDADADALEAEAEEEFLLLDDLVPEGRNIDLPERPDDMASVLDMTFSYRGGALMPGTPHHKRSAAVMAGRTPLSALATTRLEHRDMGAAATFRIASCIVGESGALMMTGPGGGMTGGMDLARLSLPALEYGGGDAGRRMLNLTASTVGGGGGGGVDVTRMLLPASPALSDGEDDRRRVTFAPDVDVDLLPPPLVAADGTAPADASGLGHAVATMSPDRGGYDMEYDDVTGGIDTSALPASSDFAPHQDDGVAVALVQQGRRVPANRAPTTDCADDATTAADVYWTRLDGNDTTATVANPIRRFAKVPVLKHARAVAQDGPLAAAWQAVSAPAASHSGVNDATVSVTPAQARALATKARSLEGKVAAMKAGRFVTSASTPGTIGGFGQALALALQPAIDAALTVAQATLPSALGSTDVATSLRALTVAEMVQPAPLHPALARAYRARRAATAAAARAATRASRRAATTVAAAGSGDVAEGMEGGGYEGGGDMDSPYAGGDGGDLPAMHDGGDAGGGGDPLAWLMAGDDVPTTALPPTTETEGGAATSDHGGEQETVYEDLVAQHMRRIEAYIREAGLHAHQSALSKRVCEWQGKIMPVLEEEDTRREFDIRQYGREIVTRMATDTTTTTAAVPTTPLPFAAVVAAPQRYEVCRSFLATLQLAAGGNVDILPLHEGGGEGSGAGMEWEEYAGSGSRKRQQADLAAGWEEEAAFNAAPATFRLRLVDPTLPTAEVDATPDQHAWTTSAEVTPGVEAGPVTAPARHSSGVGAKRPAVAGSGMTGMCVAGPAPRPRRSVEEAGGSDGDASTVVTEGSDDEGEAVEQAAGPIATAGARATKHGKGVIPVATVPPSLPSPPKPGINKTPDAKRSRPSRRGGGGDEEGAPMHVAKALTALAHDNGVTAPCTTAAAPSAKAVTAVDVENLTTATTGKAGAVVGRATRRTALAGRS